MKVDRNYWHVVERIKVLIHSGVYPAKSALPSERDLANFFNVSRSIVRSAIVALEVLQLVEKEASARVYVIDKRANQERQLAQKITPFELMQAFAFVEGEAAALAAISITADELKTLQSSLQKLNSDETLELADKRFHFALCGATKNKAILSIVKNYWAIRDKMPQVKNAFRKTFMLANNSRYSQYTAILKALKERNSDAARMAVHTHFNYLINTMFEISGAETLEQARINASAYKWTPKGLLAI